MVEPLSLDRRSDAPLYRQIVSQVAFLIEVGDLVDGDRLPSMRLLADNLHINRNTVARAYGELRERGLVASRGRAGTVVVGASVVRAVATDSSADRSALQILDAAVRECIALGLPPDQIQEMVGQIAHGATSSSASSAVRIDSSRCSD